MADKSKIEWTEATWNAVVGCSLVSQGCKNCYAMRVAHKLSKNPGTPQYHGLTQITNGHPVWTGDVRLVNNKLDEPLTWRRPRRVFVNSMSDLFHQHLTDHEIALVFAGMIATPWHTHQMLTKRPQRKREWFARMKPADCYVAAQTERTAQPAGNAIGRVAERLEMLDALGKFPRTWAECPHILDGCSAEGQETFDERLADHLWSPLRLWFSLEPLLGPIEMLEKYDLPAFGVGWSDSNVHYDQIGPQRVEWIVVGGESGPGARPMHPDWARSLRDQCAAVGVAFFFKQWGAWAPRTALSAEWKAKILFARNQSVEFSDEPVRVGKKAAGRLLDGREHNEYPAVQTPAKRVLA